MIIDETNTTNSKNDFDMVFEVIIRHLNAYILQAVKHARSFSTIIILMNIYLH